MLSFFIVLISITIGCSGKGVIDIDSKIVGGANSTIVKYPYQISLEIKHQHACGGSLITPNIVLTAAHCMFAPKSLYRVRAGTTFNLRGGHVSKVAEYWNHPKYTPTFDYDVSVIKLKQPFSLNAQIQTIKLQPVGKIVPVGSIATVTGWGDLSSGGPAPKDLHEVGVPRSSDRLCKMNEFLYKITERMVCYGFLFGGKDACQMDSGGPLVFEGKQVGIVSWGIGCAVPLFPGIYTKVSNKDIQEHINNAIKKFEE